MLFGIVTSAHGGVGFISAGISFYKFSTSHFPIATVGMRVTFEKDDRENEFWAKDLSVLGPDPMIQILKRLDAIETNLVELKKAYELPESYFTKYSGDESA